MGMIVPGPTGGKVDFEANRAAETLSHDTTKLRHCLSFHLVGLSLYSLFSVPHCRKVTLRKHGLGSVAQAGRLAREPSCSYLTSSQKMPATATKPRVKISVLT